MDVGYINPFLTSSRAVIDQMVKVPMTLCKPRLRERPDGQMIVSAVVELSGAVAGVVAIGFTQPVALALASGLACNTLKTLDSDCVDALCEIANMISGGAKKDFPSGGLTTIGVPRMILGAQSVQFPAGLPIISIPCETPRGKFGIDVALRCPPKPVVQAA